MRKMMKVPAELKKEKGGKKTSVYLKGNLHRRMSEAARFWNVPLSDIANEAISRYLKRSGF